ncbi:hypothetical protein EDB19DRAFT_807517 [Suillus lakei]|nr:hypothetical protein EDB19DRAFT_807517 [Suillus lakei]
MYCSVLSELIVVLCDALSFHACSQSYGPDLPHGRCGSPGSNIISTRKNVLLPLCKSIIIFWKKLPFMLNFNTMDPISDAGLFQATLLYEIQELSFPS